MTAAPLHRATRRGVLGGLLAGLSAAGCDATTSGTKPVAPTSGTPATDPPEDPDRALVDDVRRQVGEVAALVRATVDRRPGLAAELRGLDRLHRRHLAALPGAGQPPTSPRAHGGAVELRSRVRAREASLQRSLADAAVAARSGPLAALLASMSAAVAQQLAVPSRADR